MALWSLSLLGFVCDNDDDDVFMTNKSNFLLYFFFLMQTYVQDLIEQEFDSLYSLIVEERGHIYVCGDVTMAEHVYQTIR